MNIIFSQEENDIHSSITMNMIKHAADLEAVYTRGWRQHPANRYAVYFIIIH